MFLCLGLAFKLTGFESSAGDIAKCPQLFANANGFRIEDGKGLVRVHAEFSKPVPMRAIEEQFHYCGVVWLEKKAIKHWYGALELMLSLDIRVCVCDC